MSEATYKIKEQTLKNIANAIRTKAGKNDLISPLNMPEEILSLPLGNIDFSQQTATEENVEEGYTFFNKHGLLSTGTGGGINFKVIGGTTQPTSPHENTIWINTDVTIGEWQVSAARPAKRIDGTALQNGDAWIATTGTANASIQAIRNVGVWFKIAKCCQYINDEWVLKEVKIYQGNSWVGCRYILLDGQEVSHSPKVYESENNKCGAQLQFVETGIYYKSVHNSDKNECYYKIIWEEAVDLTNYDTCYVTFGSISGGRSGNAIVGFSTGVNYDANFAASVSYAANNTYAIDVSGLSGLHYFRVHGRRPESDVYVQLYINSVYLE